MPADGQLGGACLLGIGIWVLVDPTGFREIVATNPLLTTGAYIVLAMGGLLFLLGFLGCCGAVRENRCLLLFVSDPSPTPTLPGCGWSGGGGDRGLLTPKLNLDSETKMFFPPGWLSALRPLGPGIWGHSSVVEYLYAMHKMH